MSKRKAAAVSPPLGQTEDEGGVRRSARLTAAAARREEQPVEAAAAAATRPAATATAAAAVADPAHGQPSEPNAAANSSAGGGAAATAALSSSSSSSSSSPSPFGRLATVELQLIMHGCDRRSLIALACCSRSTHAAAAHPFAWRSQPLRLHCSRPSELTAWPPLQSSESLQLRHADLTVHWTLESAAAATAEEVASVLSLPRLRSLEIAVVDIGERAWYDEPMIGESSSIVLVNALRSQLDSRRPSLNFVLSLSLRRQRIGPVGAAAITDLVERSPSLTKLDLEDNTAIQGDALIALAVAAGNSSSLRSLKIIGCGPVDVAMATALVRALTQSHSLTELDLRHCGMDAASVEALSPGVKASSSLQRLHLSNDDHRLNRPGSDSIAVLAAAVAASHSLTELGLAECDMGGNGVVALAAIFQQCSTIRRLHLGSNSLGGESMAALGRLLSADQCQLAFLDLADNAIDDADMVALAESLQFNTSLTEMHLPNFPNLVAFIAPLAAALQRSGGRSALRTLELEESDIGPSGVAALSDLLRGDNAIKQLTFGQSILSESDMAALAPAIGVSRLTGLDFRNSIGLGDAGLAALVPGLCACPGLRKLNLSGCDLTPASAANLSRIVQGCRALEWLNLGGSMIRDDGSCAIFAALHSGSSLRSLFVSSSSSSMRGMAALVDAIGRGWNPTHLELDSIHNTHECVLALAAALRRRGPTLRLEWLRMWVIDLSAEAAVALVRAVHRIPTMRMLRLSVDPDDDTVLSAVRAACSERPEVAVGLLEASDDIDAEGQC